jgi:branched-chain amino acid aminotransferase group I
MPSRRRDRRSPNLPTRRYGPDDLPDPRNAEILVHIDGALVPRNEARVSVFDSVVQGGDAVWEGLRVYDGRIFAFDRHLDRLFSSAHALRFEGVPDREEVRRAVIDTLTANGMYDGAHVRLTLTRGPKVTSGMSPALNRAGCTLIVLAEWKDPVYEESGIRLITSSIRRNSPATLDSKIHHNNLLNNILAKIEAEVAGADDALMLDLNGFVAETNATNVFLVKNHVLTTPTTDACMPGVTRAIVLEIAAGVGVPTEVRNVSLTEVYTAQEVFTTGTMGELSPVLEVDGRTIGNGAAGPLTQRMRQLHRERTKEEGEALPPRT